MKPPKRRSSTKPAITAREIKALLQAHQEALEKFTARRIGLFGSYAIGKQSPKSDVDLVVDFAEPTFDNFMGLVNYLEEVLGKKVNVLTPQGLESIRVPKVAETIKRSVLYV
jgi:predicted nucleotidyltransferase